MLFKTQPAYLAYRLFSSALFLFFLPFYLLYIVITGRFNQRYLQRLGVYSQSIFTQNPGRPRIWLHAVSVGEAGVAAAILEELTTALPNCSVVLSTTTRTGQEFARAKVPAEVACVYAPIDFIPCVRKALTTIQPDVVVLLETEIWPNWLTECHRFGIPTALVNGRISVRSIHRYLKIRSLMKSVLAHIEAFDMISPADAARIQSIGAFTGRIAVSGNAKYDRLLLGVDESQKNKLSALFNLTGQEPVFVAGSIRGNEPQIVLEAFDKIRRSFPDTLLIIAPRHIERAYEIESLTVAKGFYCQLRSRLDKPGHSRTAEVIVLDSIGELLSVYGLSTVAFCGGSLVPLGGQNILEPAVWGKPVLFGPSMEDFQDAKDLLDKTGGGIQVADGPELAEKILYLLEHPEEAHRIGRLAHKAILSHQGAARKHVETILKLLKPD